jgi:carboxyl-terminal processing protease
VNRQGYIPSKLQTLSVYWDLKTVRNLSISLCLGLLLILPVRAAESTFNPNLDGRTALAIEIGKSAHPAPVTPGTNDGRIAYVTSWMLEHAHYLHLKFDSKLSSRFLDRYIDTLDPQHMYFLQSDIAEFDAYRDKLGTLTTQKFDTSPAYVIFNRFMERLEQQANEAEQILVAGPPDFTQDDRMDLNRKDKPFPKDMAEARELWQKRARYEYLQERLNKESPEAIAKVLLSRHDAVQFARSWRDMHDDIVNIIGRRYSRVLRNFREWDSDKVLEIYLTSLAHVYDPHSDFFDRSDLENFSISMSLSLFGIGAVLGSEDGYCKISELNPSGPAAKSKKIKANDRIVAVAQGTNEPVDVVDMPLNKVVDLIRGPKGTEVRLTIIPASAVDPSTRTVVSIIRDQIKLEDQQAKAKIIDLPDDKGQTQRVGVIDLPSFYASFPLMGSKDKADIKSTTADVAKLLEKLKAEKVRGVILDLRRNGGGSLEEAINLTGLFIKEGPVVQVKDWNGEIQVDKDPDPGVEYDGPLVVLTSRFSASASEILAGALQDYGRALLVGDARTHGKGTVQSLNQLAPHIMRAFQNVDTNLPPEAFGALKLTTRKFYRASGASTQLRGVVPDIVLPSVDDHLDMVGEDKLDNPLEYDTIPTAPFEKLNRVQPYLADLEKRSTQRVASEKDFDYVREDIKEVDKAVADKTVSLNEEQRLKEKDDVDVRRQAREAEIKARKIPPEIGSSVTLKNGEVVVEPLGKTNSITLATTGKSLHPPLVGANGTNAALMASADANTAKDKATAVDDDPDAEKVPSVDVELLEAERILTDYISLLAKEPALTANP